MNSEDSNPSQGLSAREFYRAVYENLPQGIIVIKNERVFFANRAYSRIVGYPIETIMSWTTSDIFKPLMSHQEKLRDFYEGGIEGEIINPNEVYLVKAGEGKIKYVEMIPTKFTLHDGDYYHAMVLDVTEKIMAIKDLKQSEERFRNTFESIPESAYLWEKRDSEDITLRMANRQSIEVLGGSIEKHLGRNPNNLFVDNPEFSEYISFSMETGQRIKTETTISYPDQSESITAIVDCVRPAENLVLMMITDITEERQAQENAKRSEKEKAIILDSMRDHLIYYESDELQIAWTNKAAAASVGLTPAELVGKYCYEVWQLRSEPCVDCPVIKAWETGKAHVFETKSPDNRMWLVKGLPAKNMANKVTSVVEVTREITAEKEAERITKEAKDRAELYLDLLSHDLNNIHQGITIGLELVLLSENLTSDTVKSIEASLKQVNRGISLIANVQKFSTILDSPTNLVQTKLLPIIELAIQMVRSSFPRRELRINLDLPDDEVMVQADEFLVDAIFNLLHNTMKHDTNDVVQIDVRINKSEDSRFIIFCIDDRGPGVDEEYKEVLLNRLESGVKVGTGMGLTLVKRIMDRYKGKIVLQDRVAGDYKKGACFMLYLPIG